MCGMGARGPTAQRRRKITCHLGIRATKLFEEKLPELPKNGRGHPLIGAYLSVLIERDLFKRESELVAKFKDTPPTPKMKSEPASKIEASPKPKMRAKTKTKPGQKLVQKDKAAPPKPETKPEKTWLEKG
jgi:hypothetical protein